jgi:hypothetical protein
MAFTALLFFRPQDRSQHSPACGWPRSRRSWGSRAFLRPPRARPPGDARHAGTGGRRGAGRRDPAARAILDLDGRRHRWTFTDLYVKVVLIFLLMLNTLNATKRIEQFTGVIVLAHVLHLAFAR